MRDSDERKALYNEFRQKAIEPDTNLLLLNARDAADLLAKGMERGLVLAGVEGFVVTDEGAYQPRQDFSNDYADWPGSRSEFVNHTRELLARGAAAGIRFEVIFESGEGKK